MNIRCIEIIIKGNVENRGMAFQAMNSANKFSIKGIAKYNKLKNLILDVEGSESQLKDFLIWCINLKLEEGINEIIINDSKCKNYSQFDIATS